jgi:hypothetical protein
MERRYLAATLALAVTFAVFSHGFNGGCLAKLTRSRAKVLAELAYAKRYVAQQLVAKLEPYTGSRTAEQAQIVAELNLPELARVEQRIEAAPVLVQQEIAKKNCEAALRAQKVAQHVYRMRILAQENPQVLTDLAVIRGEDPTARANEWRAMADADRFQFNFNIEDLERAQKISVRAVEQARRAMERSHPRVEAPHAPGMPMHINFVTPAAPDFTISVPAAPELSDASIE